MAAMHATALQADWESTAPLPEPNGGFMAGCVDGKIIIAGGTNWVDDVKHWLDRVHVYDPAADRWSAGPKLPHPLAYAASGSDGTKLFFAGGADGAKARREVYALDAALRLAKLGELPRAVAFPGGAVQDGRLYVLGGTPDPDDWGQVTAELLKVDLASGKTGVLPSLSALGHGLGIPAVVPSGSVMHTFSGAWLNPSTKEVTNVREAFAYDFATRVWRDAAPFHKPVRGLNAVLLDDRRIYLAGGYGTDEEGFLGEAFIFDAVSGRYNPAKAMPYRALTCLVKCGAHVYALGGEDVKKHRTAQCWRIRIEELANP